MDTFREWVSDNLRYILLILLIAVLALLCFFGIKYLNGRDRSKDDAARETAAETEAPAEDEEPAAAQQEETAEPEPTAEPEEAEEDPALSRVFLDSVPDGVSGCVSGYFEAAGRMDADGLAQYVDDLSDEDRAALAGGVPVTYTDIDVSLKPGVSDGSYLAYVSYLYQTADDKVPLPGLSVFYLVEKDGAYVIKTSPLTAEEENYMNEAGTDADAQDLVARIRSAYVDALAENADEGS